VAVTAPGRRGRSVLALSRGAQIRGFEGQAKSRLAGSSAGKEEAGRRGLQPRGSWCPGCNWLLYLNRWKDLGGRPVRVSLELFDDGFDVGDLDVSLGQQCEGAGSIVASTMP